MAHLLQYVLNGLANGSIYALIALGIVVIYRGTNHLNFAQGEMALLATAGAWWINEKGVPLALSILLAASIAFVGGGVIEFGLIRPAGKKSPFAVVVVTIGLFQALNSFTSLLFPKVGNGVKFGSLFPNKPADFFRLPGGTIWRYERLGVLVTVLVITGLLFALFQKTKIGLAIRMVANNPDSARLSGVPTTRILMMSWGISAFIGAIGGSLIGGINANINISTMFGVFLLASAAATLGGLDSPLGALVGGLSLGVVESLVSNYPKNWWASSYIGADTAIAVAFVIILVVLLVRPSGLFGSSRVERV
ncbi:MAG: branched-chain amino acid transporter permease [Ilumatobacteraceae bacterium]|nr:branched-chain amino acid transporter permease [Ilumatobacteraceae bacterium]